MVALSPALLGAHPRKFSSRSFLPNLPQYLWVLEAGYVRTFSYTDDGSVIILGIWGPGDVIGPVLSSIEPFHMEAVTSVQARMVAWQTHSLKPQVLESYLRATEALFLIRTQKRVDVMLIKLLQWLGKRFGRPATQGQLIELRLTHQDVSEILGVTRVTITRTFGLLEQQGLIQRLPLQQVILRESDVWHYEI